MIFNSYGFIFAFLPLFIILYFFCSKHLSLKISKIVLVVCSLIFYIFAGYKCLIVLLCELIINYIFHRLICAVSNRKYAKLLLTLAIVIDISVLVLFKYTNYIIFEANGIIGTDWITLNLIVPLGLSFFTFSQISFMVDCYKEQYMSNILDYLCFSLFFPTIASGPIIFYKELMEQLNNEKNHVINYDNLFSGLILFTIGLFKKVFFAKMFGAAADTGYELLASLDTVNAIVVMLSYTLQIYFDFSAYSDMAIGVARMYNIELPMNFNSPYKSLNILEFWDRWHITLTRFFTRYIYIPLGGSRKGRVRTYINIFIIFLISGIWHGANITFVIWGTLHGVMMIITRMCKSFADKLHPAFNWIVTFLFTNISWIYFRADTRVDAHMMLSKLLLPKFDNINLILADNFNIPEIVIFRKLFNQGFLEAHKCFPMYIMILLGLTIVMCAPNSNEISRRMKPGVISIVFVVVLLIWSLISFSGVNSFVYFAF